MHPAAAVGGEFHWHAWGGERVDEGSLRRVNHQAECARWTRRFPPWSGARSAGVPSEILPSFLAILQRDRREVANINQMFQSTSTHRCTLIGSVPLVQLVYPRELLTSYWPWAGRGMSRMLEMCFKLSFDARLLCSSGPVGLVGESCHYTSTNICWAPTFPAGWLPLPTRPAT